MSSDKPFLNTLQLTQFHRVTAVVMIIIQYTLFAWIHILLINYHAFTIPFINYPSLLDDNKSETHYGKNMLLYILFWIQHISMATLRYKIAWFRRVKYFALYDRYIYNISASLTLWYVFSNLQPSYYLICIVPVWICLPFNIAGFVMLFYSIRQLGGRVMMPYKMSDILHSKTINFLSYEANNLRGLKTDGIYAYSRNPMQMGALLLIIFGNGHYTVERLLFVLLMVFGVIIGVLME